MHRFLRLFILLISLFSASSYAAQSAKMTGDSLGPIVEQPIDFRIFVMQVMLIKSILKKVAWKSIVCTVIPLRDAVQ